MKGLGRRRQHHRLPRLRVLGPCGEIGLRVGLPVGSDVLSRCRIVCGGGDRWRKSHWWPGLGHGGRRCGQRYLRRRAWLRHALARQGGVRIALPVFAVVEWHVGRPASLPSPPTSPRPHLSTSCVSQSPTAATQPDPHLKPAHQSRPPQTVFTSPGTTHFLLKAKIGESGRRFCRACDTPPNSWITAVIHEFWVAAAVSPWGGRRGRIASKLAPWQTMTETTPEQGNAIILGKRLESSNEDAGQLTSKPS